jgi:hypothetical protein
MDPRGLERSPVVSGVNIYDLSDEEKKAKGIEELPGGPGGLEKTARVANQPEMEDWTAELLGDPGSPVREFFAQPAGLPDAEIKPVTLNAPPTAGAEEVVVMGRAELDQLEETDAKELAAQAEALGASDIILIPEGLLTESTLPPEAKLHLYAHENVMAGAYTVLPVSIWSVESLQIHELPEDPGEARKIIGGIPEGQLAVMALEARFKGEVAQFFPDPKNHPLAFLMTPGKWTDYLNYRKEIAALLLRPAGQRRNLILFLSAGSVVQRELTIDGKKYGAAIFA